MFLLPAGEASAWHRVSSDETWLAHQGRVLLELGGTGAEPQTEARIVVGCDLGAGERAQALVEAGHWQRTVATSHDALASCLVSPGFDFADFELARRS